jgi:hypothetical protein
MVGGLVLLALAIASQVWLVALAGALGVIGNALGLWNQLVIRRRA